MTLSAVESHTHPLDIVIVIPAEREGDGAETPRSRKTLRIAAMLNDPVGYDLAFHGEWAARKKQRNVAVSNEM